MFGSQETGGAYWTAFPSPETLRRLEWEIGAAVSTGRQLDGAELAAMFDEAGLLHAADLLYSAVISGVVSAELLASVMADAWRHCYPHGPDRDAWIWMFRRAGFTRDGKPAELPGRQVRLYRGAPPDARHGMSWTPSRSIAHAYSRRSGLPGQPCPVWTADIPPGRLLCHITWHDEEYVADVQGLDVRRVK